ncbi:MAG: hypothetical protein R2762_27675 [Bryobacteraceae bacterium]
MEPGFDAAEAIPGGEDEREPVCLVCDGQQGGLEVAAVVELEFEEREGTEAGLGFGAGVRVGSEVPVENGGEVGMIISGKEGGFGKDAMLACVLGGAGFSGLGSGSAGLGSVAACGLGA